MVERHRQNVGRRKLILDTIPSLSSYYTHLASFRIAVLDSAESLTQYGTTTGSFLRL